MRGVAVPRESPAPSLQRRPQQLLQRVPTASQLYMLFPANFVHHFVQKHVMPQAAAPAATLAARTRPRAGHRPGSVYGACCMHAWLPTCVPWWLRGRPESRHYAASRRNKTAARCKQRQWHRHAHMCVLSHVRACVHRALAAALPPHRVGQVCLPLANLQEPAWHGMCAATRVRLL